MSTNLHTVHLPLRLRCPVWNCAEWVGEIYPSGTPKSRWLHWYSRTFNTVEGNSTFYGLPSLDVARRWADHSVDGFRFALKVPQTISHDAMLIGCERELEAFLTFADVLHCADRLGPSFLQLPPAFGPNSAACMERFLDRLPRELPWAVEVRHHDWFDQSHAEQELNDMLRQRGINKVLFDSRPLYQAPPDDEIEAISQSRKPKTPVRQTVTSNHPMLRLVGRNRIELAEHYVQQWLPIIAQWINEGLEPYVFTHAPDDRFAPQFAKLFWQRYCQYLGDDLAAEFSIDSIASLPKPPKQMEFF